MLRVEERVSSQCEKVKADVERTCDPEALWQYSSASVEIRIEDVRVKAFAYQMRNGILPAEPHSLFRSF